MKLYYFKDQNLCLVLESLDKKLNRGEYFKLEKNTYKVLTEHSLVRFSEDPLYYYEVIQVPNSLEFIKND